jgi:hypothetical protein
VSFDYPAAPQPTPGVARDAARDAAPDTSPDTSSGARPGASPVETPPRPDALRPVLSLLLINLGLSIALTIAVLILRNDVITFQLDHQKLYTPDQRAALRDTYTIGLWSRVGGNILVSIIYVFLVRALLRGRRWAYRRVIVIGAIGVAALISLQAQAYPVWMRMEQVIQSLVLVALLWCVLRPEVRAYFAKDLPGRTVRRFRRE